MERRLSKKKFCALTRRCRTPFEGQPLVAAGWASATTARKRSLGIRQGATENATVVGELLGDLMNRGLDFSRTAHLRAGWRQKRCIQR